MSGGEKKEIHRLINECFKRSYGSLQEPTFEFVNRALVARPYDHVVQSIDSSFHLEEITDPNDDVSFGYTISRGHHRWLLELSMLGWFGVLLRVDGPQIDVVETNVRNHDEKKITEPLERAGFRMFERQELERPIALRLFNTEPHNVRLYQALFSDSDILPWA